MARPRKYAKERTFKGGWFEKDINDFISLMGNGCWSDGVRRLALERVNGGIAPVIDERIAQKEAEVQMVKAQAAQVEVEAMAEIKELEGVKAEVEHQAEEMKQSREELIAKMVKHYGEIQTRSPDSPARVRIQMSGWLESRKEELIQAFGTWADAQDFILNRFGISFDKEKPKENDEEKSEEKETFTPLYNGISDPIPQGLAFNKYLGKARRLLNGVTDREDARKILYREMEPHHIDKVLGGFDNLMEMMGL